MKMIREYYVIRLVKGLVGLAISRCPPLQSNFAAKSPQGERWTSDATKAGLHILLFLGIGAPVLRWAVKLVPLAGRVTPPHLGPAGDSRKVPATPSQTVWESRTVFSRLDVKDIHTY